MTPVASFFTDLQNSLPPDVAQALLFSGDGETRLFNLAVRLLETLDNTPSLLPIFRDVAVAAWECSPLSGRAAFLTHQVQLQSPFLSGQTAFFCAQCATLRPFVPERATEINAAIKAGQLDSAKKLVVRHANAESGNLFWWRFASYLGIQLGELDWYEPWLDKPPMPSGFVSAFRADYSFARGQWADAAALYAKAFERTHLSGWLVREGECHLRLGERDHALKLWRDALAMRPWQINLLLRVRDLERNSDLPGPPPLGRGEILLYSWNHGRDLDNTLKALAASHLDNCGLTVLDNGSNDDTPEVLRAWSDHFGHMRTVSLPTNVGAPAARNWLLSLESSKAADWVVFLDDDALVPPDWLGLFGTALRQYPQAGIIGCRVVDMAAPLTIQSVDLHFESGLSGQQKEEKEEGGVSEKPRVVDSHMDGPDFGQYSYLRPAVSVTGCCHLLTRANLDSVGLFDLRFSPSQFDDFERDLRSCTQDIFPLYQGHLQLRHIKRSGAMAGISPWQQANIAGNLTKLWGSYPPHMVESITEQDSRRVWEDLSYE